jgi:nitrate/nitrite-specific signal transduction histidine kinase
VAAKKYEHDRHLVNYLLQPLVQLRIGFINVCLSLIFVLLLGAYVYMKFVQFADVVTTLTEANDEIGTMLRSYLESVGVTAAILGVIFVVVSLLTSIYFTHRLVGPTVAFRRHIDALIAGDYKVKTTLRNHDAFTEVAESLNKLSDRLAQGR